MEEFQFTKRVHKILRLQREESEYNIIHPIHLFIGMCKEGTGVCAELYMYLFHKVIQIFQKNFRYENDSIYIIKSIKNRAI